MKKIQICAIRAKELGYSYISSVVKGYKASIYYHVLPVDWVIANGWTACNRQYYQFKKGGGAYIKLGIKNRPDNCIARTELLKLA